MQRFNWTTLIKLALASLAVGAVMAFLGADPFDFWEGVYERTRETIEMVFGLGWGGVSTAVRFMAYGAIVVLPIWAVTSLLKRRGPRRPERY
ncbi:hypothetical protein [Parvularcula sp. LCG005]|uniref:hypothetical protein n=1 Tax=Parvularcula sp. LCG005 TaxID=3078805 RepID=UPI002941CB00|nr:hypothetical protein [Parvularcula sp. LCG005]WOI52637.1 hypothetical protein RUI03_10810 [Parvularcula sp. LCG005]